MNSTRERVLMEMLKEIFFSIQNSTDILKEKNPEKWKTKVLKLNKKEIDKVSKKIAHRVEKVATKMENEGNKPSIEELKIFLSKELEKIGQ
jgi:glycosylphosphatidylinositol transamidase (GPIT) subunit GPI8